MHRPRGLMSTQFDCLCECRPSRIVLPRRFLSRHHRITRSALTSTFGGIVRPICLAAFRLMMNSNFYRLLTGRSAGFAPFKILSTYVAARRNKSTMFAL